jgi:hypothetical protein
MHTIGETLVKLRTMERDKVMCGKYAKLKAAQIQLQHTIGETLATVCAMDRDKLTCGKDTKLKTT